MTFLLIAIFFALGLIIGSFLNVVIYRFNTHKDLGGRSACMSCQSQLKWYELIPLASFFILKGRCRTCKTQISLQYPMVELATGLIFIVLFLKFQGIFFIAPLIFSLSLAYYAILFSLLVVIAVYDMKHKIIPDILSFVFGSLAFLGLFLFSDYQFYPHWPLISEILAGVYLALPFALLWLVSRGAWMGLGDAKLALGLGWFLGLSQALSAIVLAFWFGAGVGIFLLLFFKKGVKSEIPFAPFLVLGTFIAFLLELRLFMI